jgi:NAD(P)-dependent dehydrogenase (short-subunit alcohol dehydrogenase family)
METPVAARVKRSGKAAGLDGEGLMAKTWFLTGCGSGLGRALATAALERGDRVAASARRIDDVAELADRFGERALPMGFDVRDRSSAAPALAAARERFGRLDVVVNNAARGLVAALEEVEEAEVRDLIDTNLLGVLWVTQAALPILRAQGGGHIVQISSGGGVISWPANGVYQASKWGIEGMSEALAQEARHLGIKVTIGQVGHMESGLGRSVTPTGAPIEAYAQFRQQLGAMPKGNDPAEVAAKVLKVADMDDPPLRVLLGRPLADIRQAYEGRLALWERWEGKL